MTQNGFCDVFCPLMMQALQKRLNTAAIVVAIDDL